MAKNQYGHALWTSSQDTILMVSWLHGLSIQKLTHLVMLYDFIEDIFRGILFEMNHEKGNSEYTG